jgi:hypothetical protein
MDREQAVNIIKQIFDRCQQVEGKSIKLIQPEESSLSKTFEIHIQILSGSSEVLESCVRDIAAQNNLAVKIKNGWLIVYKSYQKNRE